MEVSSVDTDLAQTGILDSLALVELLTYIEKEFGTEISLDNIEIEDFHSIARIAEYVNAHSPVLKGLIMEIRFAEDSDLEAVSRFNQRLRAGGRREQIP